MSVLFPHHQVLTDGIGKCSVPMWSGGLPAGFCDEPAYGKQLSHKDAFGRDRAFAPALACPHHGGPPQKVAA